MIKFSSTEIQNKRNLCECHTRFLKMLMQCKNENNMFSEIFFIMQQSASLIFLYLKIESLLLFTNALCKAIIFICLLCFTMDINGYSLLKIKNTPYYINEKTLMSFRLSSGQTISKITIKAGFLRFQNTLISNF